MKKLFAALFVFLSAVPVFAASPLKYGIGNVSFELGGLLAGYALWDAVARKAADERRGRLVGFGEFDFRAEYKLGGDAAIGAFVDVLTNPAPGYDELDEAYVYAEGPFGRVEIGRARSISFKAHVRPRVV